MRIDNPRDFGRVAVVMGGDSSERAVSLDSGRCVLAALTARDINAFAVDGISALIEQVREGEVDRVFNILHGRGGEDGVVQGVLKALGVPVTGAGLLGSALSMDKARSKMIWREHALPTANFVVVRQGEDPVAAAESLSYPLFAKPVSEGSSVGISRVDEPAQLLHAVAEARRFEDQVMLETFIDGDELTVGIVHDQALPVVRIEPAHTFYDYEAKYADDAGTRYHCPSGLSEHEEQTLGAMALRAFAVLGCSGWGRVDFLRDRKRDQYFLLEANTTPGMTSHSLVPKAAASIGVSFEQLVWQVLETSFAETGGRA